MFKLHSVLKRYSRGIKFLAEVKHISIAAYVLHDASGISSNERSQAIPTIAMNADKETYYLEIPLDMVDSVCARLYAVKQTIESGRRVDASDLTITVVKSR